MLSERLGLPDAKKACFLESGPVPGVGHPAPKRVGAGPSAEFPPQICSAAEPQQNRSPTTDSLTIAKRIGTRFARLRHVDLTRTIHFAAADPRASRRHEERGFEPATNLPFSKARIRATAL